MGKLRDWWPSDEMVEQIRSSSSNSAAATSSRSGGASAQVNSASATLSAVKTLAVGPTAAATLRLSEVAAALNAMPNHPPNSVASTPNAEVGGSTSSPLSNLSPTKPAAIRLTNTQAHKEELLKKVLSRSESSTDLQMCLPQKTHTPSSLPSSPVHTIASPVRTSNAQQPRKSSFTSIIERGMQRKAEAANKPFTNAIPTEDAADLQKRKRDTSLTLKRSTVVTSPDTEDNVQTPATPAATPELSTGMQKETLTRREIHIFSERQRRKGMTHLYTILHSLLPDAKPKTDRCTVLTEAMDYIHELQMRLNELGTQKNEILESIAEQLQMDSSNLTGSRMQGGVENVGRNFDDLITEEMREEILAAADVVVRFCGRDAFITLNSPRRNGVWSAILHVLHEQDMDLLNVTLSTSNDMDYHCIHAKVLNAELHSNELQRMLQEVVLNHAVLD
ncbi:hypothetical protein GOP47_0025622 [Adiantum capillus-veneris]|uniref:BHLH domain-containing protein n=1 Tax=Adiantum capillus-veneris TaxID=13818 RepID=A0A9D4Z2D4_ADICA|nr:hypothetical protein GOP47_0025622 [Adiantum capillus-veneris]